MFLSVSCFYNKLEVFLLLYERELDNLLLKSLKSDCMIPDIKVGKSSFTVGNRVIQYDNFFMRPIEGTCEQMDYSLFALWYVAISLHNLETREPKTYKLVKNVITSFSNSYKVEERSEFLKRLLRVSSIKMYDGMFNDCEEELIPILKTVIFLGTSFLCNSFSFACDVFIDVLFLYFSARDDFFKVFKICSGLCVYILDELFNYCTHPKFKLPAYKFNGKWYPNSVGYNLSQALKLIVELSDLVCIAGLSDKEKDKKDKKDTSEMILFNDERNKFSFSARFDEDELTFLLTKSVKALIVNLESSSLTDSYFSDFIKTGDFNCLIARYNNPISVEICEGKVITLDEHRCEGLARQLRVHNKKYTEDNIYLLGESLYTLNILTREAILSYAGSLFILSGLINNLEGKVYSLQKDYDNLSEKYRMLKSNSKQSKRSVEDARQAKLKSEKKVTKLENELSKFKKESVPRSDFDELESSYNTLLGRIGVAERSLKENSNILAERKSECSRLAKENKQLKAQILQIKGLLTELGVSKDQQKVSDKEEVSVEDKIAFINQFNTIMVGGLVDLQKVLTQMGYTSFTRCSEVSDFTQGISCDLVVICTNFCSHSIVKHAKCHLKDTDFVYFNNDNALFFIDLVYNHYYDLLNG